MGVEIRVSKKPKGCTILEGFPGFGLVGTIATEFLINHLQCEEIGQVIVDGLAPMVAIHTQRLVKPISLYYSKDYNLLIVHAITPGEGQEWALGKAVMQLAEDLQAKQVISIEGVLSQAEPSENVFFYTSEKAIEAKLMKAGCIQLKEGIIVGVTATLLALDAVTFVSLFAEVHSQYPDARAAASVIKALDTYLGLEVDPKPLMKQAELFEAKLKALMEKGAETTTAAQQKQISYVG
jgi:uncharacterized protein